MTKRGLVLGLFGVVCLAPVPAHAQGVAIDHNAVGCIVAGQYPKLNACFAPASDLARARVYFRAAGGPFWYFVDMKSDQPCLTGVLPKPKKSIQKLEYYIEAVDKGFAEARTAEYDPQVVADAGECRKDVPVAPFVSKASVAVGAAAGAPAVPVGFAAGGVIGAGAAGTAAVVAGVAGAGAAGVGIAASTGGGGGTTTTPASTQPPGTQPSPAPPSPPPPTSPPPSQQANQPPRAVFVVSPDPPAGPAPLKVVFDTCASRDPDGDPLQFFFSFGDGSKDQGSCRVTHTYSRPTLAARASVSAVVTVTDGLPGHDVTRGYSVNVGCSEPRVRLTAPGDGAKINSCPVQMRANATDAVGILSVDFEVGGGRQSLFSFTDTTEPYQATWEPYFFQGQVDIRATATNLCGNVADHKVVVDVNCFGGYRSDATRGVVRLSWTSELDAEGARGQVVVNGSAVSFPGAGRSMGLAQARRGENRVEAQVVQAGGAGTWRFDFAASHGFEAGSLHVVAGDAVSISPDAVVFRLAGGSGERVAFTFRVKE